MYIGTKKGAFIYFARIILFSFLCCWCCAHILCILKLWSVFKIFLKFFENATSIWVLLSWGVGVEVGSHQAVVTKLFCTLLLCMVTFNFCVWTLCLICCLLLLVWFFFFFFFSQLLGGVWLLGWVGLFFFFWGGGLGGQGKDQVFAFKNCGMMVDWYFGFVFCGCLYYLVYADIYAGVI